MNTNPLRTQAIKRFLEAMTLPDLAALYCAGMEVQVNAAQDGGERVEDEFKGRKWHGWSDGLQTWKSFRIPYKANTEPEYEDRPMSFSLTEHAEGIGMTGWNWKLRKSIYFAFDFDAVTGHSDRHAKKLNPSELEGVQKAACGLPYVTVRRSTSGAGLHLYVFLDEPVETKNHHEHAALARAILSQMAAEAGHDFVAKVDICGGNMWVWHRKMRGTNGLELVKAGEPLKRIPPHWPDHVKVIRNAKKQAIPGFVKTEEEDLFDEMVGQRTRVPLDESHKKLLEFLNESGSMWWWNQDQHMLVCHTADLKAAHDSLAMIGVYDTLATGKEHGADQNCFAFPMRRGAWTIRRHSRGATEHDTWEQDGSGWTRCYLNKEPDLRTASRAYGGVETEKGEFVFREGEMAVAAALLLGAELKLARNMVGRETILKRHKDGRLVAELKYEPTDKYDEMPGWHVEKNKSWKMILGAHLSDPNEPDLGAFEDVVRHVISEAKDDSGWVFKSNDAWTTEPLAHVKAGLKALGRQAKEVELVVGACVLNPWITVNYPFQDEYPGDRKWNRHAAQLAFPLLSEDEELNYPHWEKILRHIGHNLDSAIKEHAWCRTNGILTGYDYLKIWIASLIQKPLESLPYLFLFGDQNTGKSILPEALAYLFTKGIVRADQAITNPSFNAEIEGAILCVIEETEMGSNKLAYNKIKDWVTSREILIHKKNYTPYTTQNSTHWIHCANEADAVPIFPGDTRITMIYVDLLEPQELIPKTVLENLLKKEAPHFLTHVARLELPRTNDRLNVPVIETEEKNINSELNMDELQKFIREYCKEAPGRAIKFSEFYAKFADVLPPASIEAWSKIITARKLPARHPKGRWSDAKKSPNNDLWVSNLRWREDDTSQVIAKNRLVLSSGKLVPA